MDRLSELRQLQVAFTGRGIDADFRHGDQSSNGRAL
jgi:hypothetical protein